MDRRAIYEQLESIEGGVAIRDAVKSILNGLDADVKKYREAKDEMETQVSTLNTKLADLEKTTVDSVPKTEMEKQLSSIQETLNIITQERDEAKKLNEQNEVERKNGELKDYFGKSVLDSFGSKNTEMSVGYAMASGMLRYNENGEMEYNGKIGDEGIELFKTDNSHLIQNRGTGTNGGNTFNDETAHVQKLEEIMFRE